MENQSEERAMSKGAVIVTGASRGIGEAIARELAAAGYRLALVARSADKLQELATELGTGDDVLAFPGDISDFDDVQRIVKEVQGRFGDIFGLVNNAGMTRDGLLMRMSPENWHGRIINISSVIGLTGNAGQANYAASKAGIIALTKSVAKELGSRGVTSNAVAPGFIATDMTADLPEKVRADMLAQIPLKRFGEGKDSPGG